MPMYISGLSPYPDFLAFGITILITRIYANDEIEYIFT